MKGLWLFFLLWLNIITISAQNHLNWDNYTGSVRVTDIEVIEDNIWVTTFGGLIRYNKVTDEKSFYNRANANLPDNYLLSIFCNSSENIWISGMRNGIGNLKTDECVIYNQNNSGLPSNQWNKRVEVDKFGNIWVASERWIGKFDGANWKSWEVVTNPLIANPFVNDFLIDSLGNVWICSTTGLSKIENNSLKQIQEVPPVNIKKLILDNKNNLWMVLHERGVFQFDGANLSHYTSQNSSLPTNRIFDINIDNKNHIWLASDIGLVAFDSANSILFVPEKEDQQFLIRIEPDNNTIWCGTYRGELLKFHENAFSTINITQTPLNSNNTEIQLIDDEDNVWISSNKNLIKSTATGFIEYSNKEVTAITQELDGSIWIAYRNEDTVVMKINDDEITVFTKEDFPNAINTPRIECLANNGDEIWIATYNYGIYVYDGNSFINYNTDNSNIPTNEIFTFSFDNDGALWAGSTEGLIKFDGTNWTNWNKVNSDLPTNVIISLDIDPNNILWIACMDEERTIGFDYGGGLTSFDGQMMTIYNNSNSDLISNTILGVLAEDDNVWLSTIGAGLTAFDRESVWTSYNVNNSGIADDQCQTIKRDKDGYIWIGHLNGGVSVYKGDSIIQSFSNQRLQNSSISLYPNPTSNYLNFHTNFSNEKLVQAKIYDLKGRLVKSYSQSQLRNINSFYQLELKYLDFHNQYLFLKLKTESGSEIGELFFFK